MQRFNLSADDPEKILSACLDALLRPGAVLLIPTETVYGLVCRGNDPEAVKRIYQLKGRSEDKPLALFAASVAALKKHGVYLNRNAEKLAAALCPGALTVVVPLPEGGTVGFRIPGHAFVLELLRRADCLLASTSANRSGDPNALDIDTALNMLDGTVDVAVDNGAIAPGVQASTVVMALDNGLKLLRPGPVSEDRLYAAIS
ncbi:MAG: L-threonylcarbamoyladenylate synthase [Victivallales bacterium]|nr:L-threonylcarbamoyladenylate synthase [Victivallales bacterium]